MCYLCTKYYFFVFIQASDEEHAYEIMKELDVDYVLVIFGGLIGYSSDGEIVFSFCLVKTKIYIINFFADINKFLWMVRIGGSTPEGKNIKENDYYTPSGEFRVDKDGSSTLLNCLMYKLCYYRFGQVYTEGGNSLIGKRFFNIDCF